MKTDSKLIDDFLEKLSEEASARRFVGQMKLWRETFKEQGT